VKSWIIDLSVKYYIETDYLPWMTNEKIVGFLIHKRD
jgi:hypothetical protein